jgi:hypothetical protein
VSDFPSHNKVPFGRDGSRDSCGVKGFIIIVVVTNLFGSSLS